MPTSPRRRQDAHCLINALLFHRDQRRPIIEPKIRQSGACVNYVCVPPEARHARVIYRGAEWGSAICSQVRRDRTFERTGMSWPSRLKFPAVRVGMGLSYYEYKSEGQSCLHVFPLCLKDNASCLAVKKPATGAAPAREDEGGALRRFPHVRSSSGRLSALPGYYPASGQMARPGNGFMHGVRALQPLAGAQPLEGTSGKKEKRRSAKHIKQRFLKLGPALRGCSVNSSARSSRSSSSRLT